MVAQLEDRKKNCLFAGPYKKLCTGQIIKIPTNGVASVEMARKSARGGIRRTAGYCHRVNFNTETVTSARNDAVLPLIKRPSLITPVS